MTLYLFPNLLWQGADHRDYLPSSVDVAVQKIDGLIAESESGGRRFLSRFREDARAVPISLLREKVDFLLEPLFEGESWGVVSDAGLPCVADPGSQLVLKAQRRGLTVIPFVGPCSITLALMLSGLYSQQFQFHGYISKNPQQRDSELLAWEKEVGVQIFIEAPHRNQYTLDACLKLLNPHTKLCVAANLTAPDQFVSTQKIGQWKAIALQKQPTIFLLQASKVKRL